MITNSTVKTSIAAWRLMRLKSAPLVVAALLTARSTPAQSPPVASSAPTLRLPRIFSDGVVLQRGRPIAVWGWGPPSTDVVARLGPASAHARSDARGAWRLALPARSAGGPLQLIVRAGA